MDFFRHQHVVLHYKWINNHKDQTFLFINSLGTDFRIWDSVVATLQPHGNILLFDKRGHGLSDNADDTNGLKDYLDDVVALLQYLVIKKVNVIGLSIGGMIAQLLAHYHSEMIDKLILCDTRSKIADAEFWNARIQQVESVGLSGISNGVMLRWFPHSFHQQFPERVSGYRNMLERCSPKGYIQACAAIRDADLTDKSKRIKLPTLCIVGSEDLSTTPAEVKNLADLIEGSTFLVIQGSGHIPCVDNPKMLSNRILEFINT